MNNPKYECDSCPNSTEDYNTHNQMFYELHVYNAHPVEDAQRIITQYYNDHPEALFRPHFKVVPPEDTRIA